MEIYIPYPVLICTGTLPKKEKITKDLTERLNNKLHSPEEVLFRINRACRARCLNIENDLENILIIPANEYTNDKLLVATKLTNNRGCQLYGIGTVYNKKYTQIYTENEFIVKLQSTLSAIRNLIPNDKLYNIIWYQMMISPNYNVPERNRETLWPHDKCGFINLLKFICSEQVLNAMHQSILNTTFTEDPKDSVI